MICLDDLSINSSHLGDLWKIVAGASYYTFVFVAPFA